mmetsp:Transcript_2236/g.4166  ORF Transcript_2236/g.4166 Transcript_2236/m.4166 type:complete len:374 (-) Transcript_2236:632-1753(-)
MPRLTLYTHQQLSRSIQQHVELGRNVVLSLVERACRPVLFLPLLLCASRRPCVWQAARRSRAVELVASHPRPLALSARAPATLGSSPSPSPSPGLLGGGGSALQHRQLLLLGSGAIGSGRRRLQALLLLESQALALLLRLGLLRLRLLLHHQGLRPLRQRQRALAPSPVLLVQLRRKARVPVEVVLYLLEALLLLALRLLLSLLPAVHVGHVQTHIALLAWPAGAPLLHVLVEALVLAALGALQLVQGGLVVLLGRLRAVVRLGRRVAAIPVHEAAPLLQPAHEVVSAAGVAHGAGGLLAALRLEPALLSVLVLGLGLHLRGVLLLHQGVHRALGLGPGASVLLALLGVQPHLPVLVQQTEEARLTHAHGRVA